jgi:hypothetical protein
MGITEFLSMANLSCTFFAPDFIGLHLDNFI